MCHDISLVTTMMVSSGRQILLKGNPVQMCLPCTIRQCRKVCVPMGATMCATPHPTKVSGLCYCSDDPLMTVTFLCNDKPLWLLRKFRSHFLLRGITKGMNLLLDSSLTNKMTPSAKTLCYYWKELYRAIFLATEATLPLPKTTLSLSSERTL
jgi:hypothetical protein